ncbi:MAG: XdhC family protein [Pseudomonas sp.]|uniref:XdhC family protein n=1 Tax=Pseudomonas sp. TaxID=306 RepID=UPI003396AF5E
MQHLDLQVIRRALQWSLQGRRVWLCTVLSTFGSAPRAPGALLAATAEGEWIGSLSGGCVEEAFLERLVRQGFATPLNLVRYGAQDAGESVRLPCGGVLEVLVENLPAEPAVQGHLRQLERALSGQCQLIREISLPEGHRRLRDTVGPGPRVERREQQIRLRIGPAQRLLLAGYSSVAAHCVAFGQALGFEVLLCEPREEVLAGVELSGVELRRELPALAIAAGACHGDTAVLALTHDPRMDDLTLMEAVRSDAFYIGVMGSRATSLKRFERLRGSGGLTEQDLARIQAPIGLALGSKTPAEIALAVMADVLRLRNGIARDCL